ncbi:MAG: class D sortase [Clostridiales bacterium]|nr:class D sortase [Clostridiales bacterium]
MISPKIKKRIKISLLVTGCCCIVAAVVHEVRLYPWNAKRAREATSLYVPQEHVTVKPDILTQSPAGKPGEVDALASEKNAPESAEPERLFDLSVYKDGAIAEEAVLRGPEKTLIVDAVVRDNPDPAPKTDAAGEAAQAPTEKQYDDYNLGVVTIPVLDVSEKLLEGTTNTQMHKGIGHLTGSSMPGRYGNCVISAHRSSSSGMEPFRYLDLVQNGDLVYVSFRDVEYTYEVFDQFIVPIEDESVLQPAWDVEMQMLTVITCDPLIYPGGNRPNRLIVRARLVGSTEI